MLAIAVLRRRGMRPDPLATDPVKEVSAGRVIALCVAGTALVVVAFSIISFFGQRRLFAENASAVNLQLSGHQWWWEVQYQGEDPSRQFETANEIHIPVGASVAIKLKTADVIHSFWIPSLAGKMDQITGQQNELRLSASRPGIYRGQCAEFCGKQHAKMAIFVVASSTAEFDTWRENQIRPAATPSDPAAEAGMHTFFYRGCILCHTVRGTSAGGKLGPDLTHVASRKTIAAGTLPNTPGNLGGWIADPQHIKPGAQMPSMRLDGQDLSSLVTYLAGLR